MRGEGSEEDECDAGEEPEEHPDDGKSTSTEMAMPGITNVCSPPPRRAPDLSSAPHLSSTAPHHFALRNCAPSTSRSANRVAQLPSRNSLRAAAPTHRANSFAPNQ
jgi:hypothetical protein